MSIDADENARLRRNLQATHQALLDAETRLERVEPIAAAAHPFCAAWLDNTTPHDQLVQLRDRLMDAHLATTPSPTPSAYVLVKRVDLDQLRITAALAGVAVAGCWDEDEAMAAWVALRKRVGEPAGMPAFVAVEAEHFAWMRKAMDAAGEWATADTGDDSPAANNLRAVLDEVA